MLRGSQDPAERVGLDPRPARPQHPQRGRRGRWTTGPARSSPTSAARATRPRAPRSSSPSSTSWPTAGASRARRSSPSTTLIGIDDKTLTASTMFMDVATNFGGELHPDPGRQAGARPGPPAQRAPVLAQHPGHQGDDHQRPRPRLRAHPGLRADLSEHGHARSCPRASARSRPTRSTCLGATARSPTAACACRARRSSRSSTTKGTQIWPIDDTPSQGERGRQPAGGLHHHGHPGRQHRPRGQPVLGRVGRSSTGRSPPAGRLQDGHDER